MGCPADSLRSRARETAARAWLGPLDTHGGVADTRSADIIRLAYGLESRRRQLASLRIEREACWRWEQCECDSLCDERTHDIFVQHTRRLVTTTYELSRKARAQPVERTSGTGTQANWRLVALSGKSGK